MSRRLCNICCARKRCSVTFRWPSARRAEAVVVAAAMGRDLENLFDLELDTEKNQYETGQQSRAG